MKELSYLNKYLFRYKWHLIFGLLFVVISVIFQIVPAQVVRYAIDLITNNIYLFRALNGTKSQVQFYDFFAESVLILAIIILGLALLRGFFLYLVRQTIIVMSRLIEYDLKNEIYSHYQKLPLSFYRRNNTGDLLNRISEDVGRVRMYLGPSIMYGMQLIVLFLILIPVMISISLKLTLFALAPLPFLSFSIYYVNNIIEYRSEEIQKHQSALSTFVQEAFSGIRVIKSFIRENESIQNFNDKSNDYRHQSLELTRVQSFFFPLIMSLIGLSTVLTIYEGGLEVIQGTLTFGNIAEFIIYVNLLTWPVASLGWTSSLIQRAEASQKRINEFLRTKSDIVSERNLTIPIKGTLEFQNVFFTYPDTGIRALKNISFRLQAGKSLAIIGATGSGKSTLSNLITRSFDATQGKILIDGMDIKFFNLSSLRSQIGVVPQDVFLFSDTIFNNISFGLIDYDKEKVVKASKDADIYNNITELPLGFDTRVGERGITLSGGQKQRVAIARAIVREPKILILDNALSAVDTETENTILNHLRIIMKNRTTLIISHRVSSAKLADTIIVLDDGVITETGTHENLIELKGAYQELYNKQLAHKEEN